MSSDGDARISRAGDRLQRRDHHRSNAELAQRRERQREHDGRAVGIGHDRAAPAAFAALGGEQREMIGIDFGNEQAGPAGPCGSCGHC